ncbi:hypothetical protein N9B82_04990 [Saprospiraceae bacterium]|nr:hypothetical protein [Saprospiraceae bacterium]
MINVKTISYLVMLVAIGTTSYSVFQKQQEIQGVETYKEIIHEELDSVIALHNRYAVARVNLKGPIQARNEILLAEEKADLAGYKTIDPLLIEKLKKIRLASRLALSEHLCLTHFSFVKSHSDSLYFGTNFSSICNSDMKFHVDINGIDMTDVGFSESIYLPLSDSITITTTKMQINDRQRIDTTSTKQLYIYQNSAWLETLP